MSLAPSYSSEPGPDEQRLEMAAQRQNTNSPIRPFSTLTKRGSGVIITLHDQQEDALRATYGRGSSVEGEISLESTHGVTCVGVTFEGKVVFMFNDAILPYPKILQLTSTLWEADGAKTCPSILPFRFTIPETFVEPKSGSRYPLPPSYDSALLLQNFHVRCTYQISVLAVRSGWSLNKSLSVPLEYVPRSLPSRNIMDVPFPFFETIKSAPEEWRQMSTTLPPKPRSTMEPVHCDLFLPSIRVFTKRDAVPFFLQLRGAYPSMLALYGTGSQPEGGWTQRLRRVTPNARTEPRITVSVERQVVQLDGQSRVRIARSYAIGTGSLRAVPPGYIPPGVDAGVLTVDYEGEIRLIPELSVGSFDMGILRLADFIVLSIEPSGSAAGHFGSARQAEGVRIVTG